MMLEALAPLIREQKVEIHIYGDGPQREALELFVRNEHIQSGVVFHGWIKHEELQEELAKNHLFVFPSIREFGGAVVIEAMAIGVVPVIVDYGGPGELVTPKTGYAVPIGTREQIVAGVRKAVEEVVVDPGRLAILGEAGRKRVATHFTWDAKASKVLEVYRWALNARSTNPESDPGFLSHRLAADSD
jgi:glycosyltransferase involved in cell wall biosynthesis